MADLVKTGVFTGDAIKMGGFGEPEVAADLAEAGRMAGFAVPAVDPSALPAGVARTPQRILVTRAQESASPSTATGPSTTCAATAAPAPACPSSTTAPGWSSRSRRWSCNSSRAATAGDRRCWSARPGRSA